MTTTEKAWYSDLPIKDLKDEIRIYTKCIDMVTPPTERTQAEYDRLKGIRDGLYKTLQEKLGQ